MNSSFIDHLALNRRELLAGSLAFGVAGLAAKGTVPVATAATPGSPDYLDPAFNLYAFGKIWSSYEEPCIGAFHGLMYVRMPGKRMIPVFGYTGTGVLLSKIDENGDLWVKSRETGYFTDLETGDILETWDNPFTGKTVEVFHFYNDVLVGKIGKEIPKFFMGEAGDTPTLMNEGTVFPDKDGRYPFVLPFQQYGDDLMMSWDYTHEHTNPVRPEGWPRSSTGPRITPSEHFTFQVNKYELEDRDLNTCRMTAGFSRLSECWPFMEMGGTKFADVTLFGRMHSHKGLRAYDDVPPKVLAYIEKHAPDYLALPKHWNIGNKRVDTWKTYALDVPPENPDYEWSPSDFVVPSGKGSLRVLGRAN
ncbi:MAG: hypothetical protein CL799_13650 [Chromatiales bacterium]|jgi:hypothetical protein|nr:hypothetical protein [Chromatiales bacterium]MDP6151231.1 DUF1838 family protein [Gammaproteobacteria bacterium]MDP7270203.1 DUF1838 family protein [Gammaproteobacteria bacterium]HJP04278.1 DUF1838 family protein [Gammaproteobacteria bacterium]